MGEGLGFVSPSLLSASAGSAKLSQAQPSVARPPAGPFMVRGEREGGGRLSQPRSLPRWKRGRTGGALPLPELVSTGNVKRSRDKQRVRRGQPSASTRLGRLCSQEPRTRGASGFPDPWLLVLRGVASAAPKPVQALPHWPLPASLHGDGMETLRVWGRLGKGSPCTYSWTRRLPVQDSNQGPLPGHYSGTGPLLCPCRPRPWGSAQGQPLLCLHGDREGWDSFRAPSFPWCLPPRMGWLALFWVKGPAAGWPVRRNLGVFAWTD